ncbi:hypothetical protein BT69DRAFT_1275362, partial [Atractiella rhizophila]
MYLYKRGVLVEREDFRYRTAEKKTKSFAYIVARVRVGNEFNKLVFPHLFLLQADLAELYIISN